MAKYRIIRKYKTPWDTWLYPQKRLFFFFWKNITSSGSFDWSGIEDVNRYYDEKREVKKAINDLRFINHSKKVLFKT